MFKEADRSRLKNMPPNGQAWFAQYSEPAISLPAALSGCLLQAPQPKQSTVFVGNHDTGQKSATRQKKFEQYMFRLQYTHVWFETR
jgi:hypothetical protein